MKLSDYLDVAALNAHVAAGDVVVQTSDHLKIFNYSKTHAYENAWTDVTRKTRGLIWDGKNDRVLAVPFTKFFNRGERPDEEPPETEQPVAVFDKRDGSLGIVWHYNSTWYVATRGSFNSAQARLGTRLLADAARRGTLLDLNTEVTYLVEIVSHQNRIVVDYRGREGLDLLGAVDRRTGREISIGELSSAEIAFWEQAGFPSYPLDRDVYESLHDPHVRGFDAEGYVLLYADGTRLKVKHDDYVRLHRIMTGLSSRDVWRHAGATFMRRAGGRVYAHANVALGVEKSELEKLDLEKLRSEVPEEMLGWLDRVASGLYADAANAVRVIEDDETRLGLRDRSDRRARANRIKELAGGDRVIESVLFAETYEARLAIIWKNIKPERETFTEDDE